MKICLIVTGGIAAVKIYDLIRLMKSKGHDIHVILTASARQFVTDMALTVLTGNKVHLDLFDLETEMNIGHIDLSRGMDLILIAPATANMIAKMANGFADDLASTTLMAANCPLYFAPAMNIKMWDNLSVQRNIKTLEADKNYHMIAPTEGLMACGEVGQGRMAEPQDILDFIEKNEKQDKLLKGKKILITAGPTREKIDPVRYISNYSSGKQGYALAEVAQNYGAEVYLVSGPTALNISSSINISHIESADEMLAVVQNILKKNQIDICLCTAAVSDWKPDYSDEKRKKKKVDEVFRLEMTQNPDILHYIANCGERPDFVAGFAAETHHLEKHTQEKLKKKGCDVIFMNDVSKDVFGSDYNHIIAYNKDGNEDLGFESKKKLSEKIMDYIFNKI